MKEIEIKTESDLKVVLYQNYMAQIKNFFGNEERAMKFLSSVMADVQRNPALLECTPVSVINSYMTMAQLGFMPSGVSGEAYVLPYKKNQKTVINGKESWSVETQAQFQMGYQGLVTLFYQAGVEKITSDIVRKNDKTKFVNGELEHEIDMTLSREERGEAIGAYVIVTFRGEKNVKYMNGKDIIAHAVKFSKSYDPKGKYSPWNPENDPELWQWRKTVLKQHAKLLPKNEIINKAIAEDNKDSILADRLEPAKAESNSLKMGNLITNGDKKEKKGKKDTENKDGTTDAEGPQSYPEDNEPVIEG